MKTNLMYCLSSVHLVSQPLHVSGIFVIHHQEVNCIYAGLFEMIVGGLTTCHTQYTSDSSICFSLFNTTTLQVFVTYLTGALYVHRL